MFQEQLSVGNWGVTNGTNYSTNGFPTRIPTTTRPSGDGVISFGLGSSGIPGGTCSMNLVLVPFGVDAGTHTASLKILAWRPTALNVGKPLWIPIVLGTWALTLGTAAGVAGADLAANQQFAGTITMTGGPTFVTSGAAPIVPDWFQVSPTGNVVGMIVQRSFGFPLLEVIFTTGGDVTSINALYAKF